MSRRDVLNPGKEIIAEILRTGDVQLYLDAGMTSAWVLDKDSKSYAVFEGIDREAYLYILGHLDKHEVAPTLDLFRKSYPAASYRLPDSDYKPSELIEVAGRDVRSMIISSLVEELVDVHDKGEPDQALELLPRYLDQLGTAGISTGTGSTLKFMSAAQVKPARVYWVWEDRLPNGTLSLSAGAGGGGKSLHAVWMAASLTRGTLPGCHLGRPKSVLWLTLEASPEKEIVPRLMAAGADLERVHFVSAAVTHTRENHIQLLGLGGSSHDEAMIEKFVKDNDVAMVVLDPITDVIGDINSKDQREVRKVIGSIHDFADRNNILVLGIAHFNKMTSVASAIDRITGSAAYSQRVRAAITFAYDAEEESYVVSQGKNNWGRLDGLDLMFHVEETQVMAGRLPLHTIRLVWDGESEITVDQILARKNAKPDAKSKAQEVEEVIRRFLGNGDWAPKAAVVAAIEEQIEVGHATVDRVAKRLVESKSQVSQGRRGAPGVLWRLREQSDDSTTP
jgi:hypothetical protein